MLSMTLVVRRLHCLRPVKSVWLTKCLLLIRYSVLAFTMWFQLVALLRITIVSSAAIMLIEIALFPSQVRKATQLVDSVLHYGNQFYQANYSKHFQ